MFLFHSVLKLDRPLLGRIGARHENPTDAVEPLLWVAEVAGGLCPATIEAFVIVSTEVRAHGLVGLLLLQLYVFLIRAGEIFADVLGIVVAIAVRA